MLVIILVLIVTYIRLDKEIERLLNALDAKVGKGYYTLFLSSDHGAVEVPSYLESVKVPSGYFNNDAFKKTLNETIISNYKAESFIKNISNNQVFLDREVIKGYGLNLIEVQQALVDVIIGYPQVYKAYTASSMTNAEFSRGVEHLLQNGFNQKRSGDVLYVLDPAVISYSNTGSTHGSALNYDTHVPLLFFGKGINTGSTLQHTTIPDIAPTMSALLGISFPNGASGKPLEFVLEN